MSNIGIEDGGSYTITTTTNPVERQITTSIIDIEGIAWQPVREVSIAEFKDTLQTSVKDKTYARFGREISFILPSAYSAREIQLFPDSQFIISRGRDEMGEYDRRKSAADEIHQDSNRGIVVFRGDANGWEQRVLLSRYGHFQESLTPQVKNELFAQNIQDEEKLSSGLTASQIAARLGVDKSSISRAITNGNLAATKVAGHWNVTEADFLTFMNSRPYLLDPKRKTGPKPHGQKSK